jgi:hypothetical protein
LIVEAIKPGAPRLTADTCESVLTTPPAQHVLPVVHDKVVTNPWGRPVSVSVDHVAPLSLELSSDVVPAPGLLTLERHEPDELQESWRSPPNTVLSWTLVAVHVAPPSDV